MFVLHCTTHTCKVPKIFSLLVRHTMWNWFWNKISENWSTQENLQLSYEKLSIGYLGTGPKSPVHNLAGRVETSVATSRKDKSGFSLTPQGSRAAAQRLIPHRWHKPVLSYHYYSDCRPSEKTDWRRLIRHLILQHLIRGCFGVRSASVAALQVTGSRAAFTRLTFNSELHL